MRIGVNTLFLVPGDVGGTEIYLRENLREMVPANPGDEFVLFTSRDNEEVFRADLGGAANVDYVRLPIRAAIRPLRILAEQTLLPFHVRRQRLDVLWSPGYTAPLARLCPQVVTIHDLQYKSHPDDMTRLERLTLDFLVRNACRRCDKIIAVSKFSASEIVRFGFAAEEKVQVVSEGVDPAFGEPSDSDIAGLVELPPGTPYILCVAHTYPHKRVHLLVEALSRVMAEIAHHLILVGKPRRGEPLVQESLAALTDRRRVHRISELRYKELIALYQQADLFVLPSVYEGFGLPVLEALLAGTPVIASRSASLPEVGGGQVVYCEKNDAAGLARCIRETLGLSREARADRIAQGRAWAASFSWTKSAAETAAVLRAAAPPNGGRDGGHEAAAAGGREQRSRS